MRILYLSDCYVESSVFASQVHGLCEHQCDFLDVTLLAHTHGKDGVPTHRYKLRLYRWIPNMSMPLIAAIAGIRYGTTGVLSGYDIVHCRGHVMSFIAIVARTITSSGIRIIADIRGESAAEGAGVGSGVARWLKEKFTRWMERVVFLKADHICFVSDAMSQHFRTMYDISHLRTSVFPTLVNTNFFYRSSSQRAEKRAELGVRSDQFLYVYSGGISYWQNIDKIISRFVDVSRFNDRFVLLILTTAPDEVKKIVEEIDIDPLRIIVLRVPYEDVGAYLNAADAGLLIRDDNILNRVASPTKANEYVACGLPIIDKLEGIGATDLSPWIREAATFRSLEEVASGHRDIYSRLCYENKP